MYVDVHHHKSYSCIFISYLIRYSNANDPKNDISAVIRKWNVVNRLYVNIRCIA